MKPQLQAEETMKLEIAVRPLQESDLPAAGLAIQGIESAKFLTPEQKQDIFYNNAARFLKLDLK